MLLVAVLTATATVAQVDWPAVHPGEAGFNAARLETARKSLKVRGTSAVLVIRNGRKVLEWYAPGKTASDKHYTASLAKALVGGSSLLLATAQGRIRPDDTAARYIPQWRNDPLKSKITIRHLATHTSGIEDANQPGVPHDELPGWMGAFWKREPDPFTIALQAPVLFEPGSAYHYSNPGMAALAYAVTASLRGAVHEDIQSVLREELMRPLGIPDEDWSIGYGRAYQVDGLDLYANWGGGGYTPRATARVGEWMMARGEWEGRHLVRESFVEAALRYAGTAIAKRQPDPYVPATTLGWYTNIDGVWPAVPRDAFAGAGAQQQLLLVIPSLQMIIVRNGAALDPSRPDQFWKAAYEYVFKPIVTALDNPPREPSAPYPPSRVIRSVTFAPESSVIRKAEGSDNWPLTWGSDGNLYTSYGDGWGFDPRLDRKLSMGVARVDGPPEYFRGFNIRSSSIERDGDGRAGPKASGMISVDGVLYMWVRNVANAQIAWSKDLGRTWQWGFKFEESFASPAFLNFGRDNEGARDQFVYTYSQDNSSAYESADGIVLARAPKARIADREAWEFFAGIKPDGEPSWTRDIAARKPVFEFPANCQRTDAVYNPAIRRYLLTVGYGHRGAWGIYDAPEPWGPWTTAFHTENWGLGQTHGYRLPSKWISKDGSTMTLVFSGLIYDTVSYDAFCVRRMKLELDTHE
jgi:CubicO group peptidase (beta-lactamase class C family)